MTHTCTKVTVRQRAIRNEKNFPLPRLLSGNSPSRNNDYEPSGVSRHLHLRPPKERDGA